MNKQEKTLKLIVDLAKLPKKRINIEGIIPLNKRKNKRFTSVVAKYIKSTGYTNEPLYYAADESETITWKCTNLTAKETEAILSEVAKEANTIYIVTLEDCEDYISATSIQCASKSLEKARSVFGKLRDCLVEIANDRGYSIDSAEDSIEIYRDGYAAEFHKYVKIYKTELT